MKKLFLVFIVVVISIIVCNKPEFTDIEVQEANGNTYIAHITGNMTVPEVGQEVTIIKTESTDWLYNSNKWTSADAFRYWAGVAERKVVTGKVIKVIKPKK